MRERRRDAASRLAGATMHPDILRLHAEIEEEHWWFVARREVVAGLVRRTVPAGEGRVVLDLGCGTGANLGALRHDYDCVGVELDEIAVSYAAERYPEATFRCASIDEPDTWELDGPVDVCLLLDVIEHLDDDRLALENAVEALTEGGHLILTVPADPRLWSRHDEHHEHRRRYTRDSLRDVVHGLRVEPRLVTGLNARLYLPIYAWRWIQRRARPASGSRTTGDLTLPPPLLNRVLRHVFAGERARIDRALDGAARPYRSGVSLLGVFRRTGSGSA